MKTKLGSALDYRRDIDGMRALAVLSVLFFHLGLERFSGGFFGVDVFFVISGYLITRLIKQRVDQGNFSFGEFYARRFRRIFPALFVTITISFAVAAILFSPQDLERFGGEAAAAIFAVSNINFWYGIGYFKILAETRPLLHTWSLSVEEQFYFVWPFFLAVLLTQKSRFSKLQIITFLTVVGLFTAEWFRNTNPGSVFFLMPFRFYEFAFGAMLVWLEKYEVKKPPAKIACQILGLVLMIVPMLFYSAYAKIFSNSPFFPCLGAALVIFARNERNVGMVLTNRIAIGIGLISYSTYLVHWPLIVFYRYFGLKVLTPTEMIVLTALSLGLGYIMYAFVEQRWRRPRESVKPLNFYLAWALCVTLLAGMTLHASFERGWLWRFPPDLQSVLATDVRLMQNKTQEQMQEFSSANPELSAKKILIIGDSQGADVLGIFRDANLSSTAYTFLFVDVMCGAVFVPESDLAAFFEQNPKTPSARRQTACVSIWKDTFARPEIRLADEIVVASLWDQHHLPYIESTIAELRRQSEAPITFIARKEFKLSGLDIINRFRLQNMFRQTPAGADELKTFATNYRSAEADRVNEDLKKIVIRSGAQYVNFMEKICPSAQSCNILTPENKIVFFDQNHITGEGSQYLAKSLADAVLKTSMSH